MVAKTASSIGANSLLKHPGAVLGNVDNIIFTELFPWGALERVTEKFSCALYSEAIWKAALMDKPWQKLTKHLQFTESVKHSDSQSSRLSSGNGSSSSSTRLLPLPLSTNAGRGRHFEGFLPPSQPQVG